jgi:hypothetical protein
MCKEPHPCGCRKLNQVEEALILAFNDIKAGLVRRKDVTYVSNVDAGAHDITVKVYRIGAAVIRIDVKS